MAPPKRSRLIVYFNSLLVVVLTVTLLSISIRADLYIRDDTADTGAEPNPSTGAMWLSPDIWIRRDPLPGWNPYPYPIASPPAWMVPTPVHQDADYRSPLSGKPNWVYVRIRNTTGTASTGTERLQLYWSSASTGLSWDPTKVGGSFIDNVSGGVLFGSEITKVRKNAATASPTERAAYIAAIRAIATNPAFVFPGGDSYWHTQQEIHRFGPSWRHGAGNPFVPSVAFPPWHREYVNRYEGLLQEANPTVKLLYWQWNPASGTNHPETGTFNYFVNTFMGASGRTLAAGVPIGGDLFPDLNTLYPTDGAVGFNGLANVVTRRMQATTNIQSDATIVGRSDYTSSTAANNFSGEMERLSHNAAHVFIGGYWGALPPADFELDKAGDQMFQPYAARDPFFFMLHGKVDEVWARWQRKSNVNLDPATTYGTATGNANIAASMGPWDGVAFPDGLANDTTGVVEPWSVAGGQIYAKPGNDRSVTSPPFYDTAPLTIPVMQPNEEVILEIPWYPPNPVSLGAGTDPAHVCMIARIETSTTSPFGMTTAETADINFNTKQNNNIAWRNISVVDTFPGAFRIVRFFLRNNFRETALTGLRLGARLDRGTDFFEMGRVRVDLGRELFERWRAAGGRGRGVEVDGRFIRLTQPDAVLEGISLKGDEGFPVQLTFELNRDYRPNKKGQPLVFDVVQLGTPRDARAIVGGQRYQVDAAKIVPVPAGRVWRFTPGLKRLPVGWTNPEFDDSQWYERRLDLGLVDPATFRGGHGSGPTTTYLRHTFEIDDPSFFRSLLMRIKRSDGAVVYLNGKQVYSANLPDKVSTRTRARAVTGVERNAFFPVKLDPSLLRKGRNVIAVELYGAGGEHGPPTFDLELSGNSDSIQEAPAVEFSNAGDGQLATIGRATTINLDALDTDGNVRSVVFMVNGERVRSLERGPFALTQTFKAGPNRVTAIVTDNEGLETRVHTTVTGVRNIPPRITVTQPSRHVELTVGDTLVLAARADDPDGAITKVEFFINDSMIFGDPARLVGTAVRPPFTLTLNNLRKRHNMITAVATDSGGARTAAIPVMVIVRPKGETHAPHR